MDKPKCRLCGKRHYGQCDFSDSGPAEAPVEKKPEKKSVAPLHGECVECGATSEMFEAAAKWQKLRDRQREYMRRKRK